jgi:hypothetical protein
LGAIGTDMAAAQPEAPVLFMIGRVAGLYPALALAEAAFSEDPGMVAYA